MNELKPREPREEYQERIAASLEDLRRWIGGRATETTESELNRWGVRLDTTADEIPAHELERFTSRGHQADLELSKGSWKAMVSVRRGRFDFSGEPTGELAQVFADEEDRLAARAAIESREAGRLLDLCARIRLPARATCTITNDPEQTGFHWVNSVEALRTHISHHTWCGLATSLFFRAQAQRLIVQEAGGTDGGVVNTDGIVAHGPGSPESWPELPDAFLPETGAAFKKQRLANARKSLPPPGAFRPRPSSKTGGALDGLETLFRSMSHSLAWLWLGAEAAITGSEVRVRFTGEPLIDLDLTHLGLETAPPQPALDQVLTLWQQAVESPNSLRFEALQKAVSVTVRKPEDLATAAEPVLRTTQLLFRIAEKGAVREAFGVRESARKAAMDAARSTADAVRSATRSVVDRVFTQLGLSVGVVVAYKKEWVDSSLVPWLLGLIFIMTLATALVAFCFEFPSARRFKDAFEADLERYRDTLTSEDIDGVKTMTQMTAAHTQLSHSVWTTVFLVAFQALALGFIWYWLIST